MVTGISRREQRWGAMPEATDTNDVTDLLLAWSGGDRDALDKLLPMVLRDLRRQASAYLHRERVGHTLQPTALVNEVYMRLVDQNRAQWKSRAHFFAVAAQLMRRILVDHARAHRADKRGGWAHMVTLDEALDAAPEEALDLIALDDALEVLAKLDARQSRVVELRYFAGLTIEETATVLGVTHATISRDWRNARLWLLRELRST